MVSRGPRLRFFVLIQQYGIRRATSLLAAERGWRVCINYFTNASAAEQIVQQIKGAGGDAIAVKADISNEVEVDDLFREVDKFGVVTGLVNNAGMIFPPGRIEHQTQEKLERIFGVNIIGPFLCAREAIKRMSVKHGGSGGAIVNVSSLAVSSGNPGRSVDYAASKGAMEIFTAGLAREVAGEGIRVNAVRPGQTRTEMLLESKLDLDEVATAIPMKRIGEPHEIAAAILWLLSNEASYVTGTTIITAGVASGYSTYRSEH